MLSIRSRSSDTKSHIGFQGVIYPGVFAFVSYWIPVEEQSFLLNFILSGSVVGTVVTMPVSAMLCRSSLGWPASFYIFGKT